MKILRTSGESDSHACDLPSGISHVPSKTSFTHIGDPGGVPMATREDGQKLHSTASPDARAVRIHRIRLNARAALQQLEDLAEPAEVEARLLRTCSGTSFGLGEPCITTNASQRNGKKGKEGN